MVDIKQSVKEKLSQLIKQCTLDTNSTMVIIAKGMELLTTYKELQGHEKRAILMSILKEIAAGKDGVIGTNDDIIPAHVIKNIEFMLETGLVTEFINIAVDITKGKFNLSNTLDVAKKSVVPCFALCGK